MRKILGSFLLCTLFMILASSCDNEGENLQYFPYQTKEDGKWGLISPDGKVLLEERFSSMPTSVYCDRFWAKDEEGYYGLHNATADAELVNHTQYRWVSDFYDGRAFVAERDNPITIIDTKGNIKVTLDEIDGMEIGSIQNIHKGMGVVVCDTLSGVVNLKGEWLVKPEYTHIGLPMPEGFVAFKGKPFVSRNEVSDTVVAVPDSILATLNGEAIIFDGKGRELFRVKQQEWPVISDVLVGGYLPVCREEGNQLAVGLLNLKGEEVLAPNPRIASICEILDDRIVYLNHDRKVGVMNFNGESLLPAQYAEVILGPNDLVIVNEEENDSVAGESPEWRLLNIHGAQVGPKKEYYLITPYLPTAQKYSLVCVRPGSWGIIDREGERLQGLPDLYNCGISTFRYPDMVYTDYVDIPVFIGKIGISSEGLDSLTFQTLPQKALERQATYYRWADNTPKAADNTYSREVNILRTIGAEGFWETVHYPNTLAQANYSKRQVIDYIDYYSGWYWYHNVNVFKGHSFRNITPSYFELTFNNSGVFRGKLSSLYGELSKRFKKMGTVTQEYKTAVVVDLGDGRQALVYMTPHNVIAQWGKLSNASTTASSHSRVRESLVYENGEEVAVD